MQSAIDEKQELISPSTLSCLSVGRLAQVVLDENENPLNRMNAKLALYKRLEPYRGAPWRGAELHEMPYVIRVLREYPE